MAQTPINAPNTPKEAKDPENGQTQDQQQSQEEPYLGNWKTREQAEEGLANLQKLLDSQGNELGYLRKHYEQSQSKKVAPKGQENPKQAEPEKPKGPDYSKEIAEIDKQIAQLDPDDDGFAKNLAELNAKSRALTAQQATQQALDAAQAEFKKALDERDVQSMHKNFYDQHPDFNEPEMQMAIDEYLNNDPTGMADPLSAYFAVKHQGAEQQLQEAQQQIADMQRRLELADGEQESGKVITKAQSPQQKTKQPKATGEDLDRGMMEALQKAKAAA